MCLCGNPIFFGPLIWKPVISVFRLFLGHREHLLPGDYKCNCVRRVRPQDAQHYSTCRLRSTKLLESLWNLGNTALCLKTTNVCLGPFYNARFPHNRYVAVPHCLFFSYTTCFSLEDWSNTESDMWYVSNPEIWWNVIYITCLAIAQPLSSLEIWSVLVWENFKDTRVRSEVSAVTSGPFQHRGRWPQSVPYELMVGMHEKNNRELSFFLHRMYYSQQLFWCKNYKTYFHQLHLRRVLSLPFL